MVAYYLRGLRVRARQIVFPQLVKLFLRYWGVRVGPGFRGFSFPVIYRKPGAEIQLGARATILNRLSENLAGIAHRTVLAAASEGARIVIGDRVGISGAVIFARTRIDIGDDTQVGANAAIYDTDFHPVAADERIAREHHRAGSAPVRIGRNVWIGANAMVLKGVTIGDDSVIAANTVVSSDVPSGCVFGGSPGRVLKELESAAGPTMAVAGRDHAPSQREA